MSPRSTDDVLAAIDGAIAGYGEHVGTDYATSDDAMRWAPDPGTLPRAHERGEEDHLALELVRALLDTSSTAVLEVSYEDGRDGSTPWTP